MRKRGRSSSGRYGWGWEKRPAPKAKEGSYRRNYGTSWWGKEFLAALSKMDQSGRLTRGKTYANKGLVENLNIKNNGKISATVQGSFPQPYKINIDWQPLTTTQQEEIVAHISGNPAALGRLLAGELPASLAEELASANIQLFPTNWKELRSECSCPDWATPCKHEAAVFYVMAGEIDTDPFRIFSLRGMDLKGTLQKQFAGIAAAEGVEIAQLPDLVQELEAPLDFSWETSIYEQLDFAALPELGERLIGLLPAKPAFDSGGDFKAYLGKIYAATKRYATRLGKVDAEPLTAEIVRNCAQADFRVNADLEFVSLTLFTANEDVLLDITKKDKLVDWFSSLQVTEQNLLCDDLLSLLVQFQFARQLAVRGAFVPQLLADGEAYLVRYLPAPTEPVVHDTAGLVYALTSPTLLYLEETGRELLEFVPTAAAQEVTSALLGILISLGSAYTAEEVPARRLFDLRGREQFDLLGTEKFPQAIQRWLNRLFLTENRYLPIFRVIETSGGLEVDILVEDTGSETYQPPAPLAKWMQQDMETLDGYALLRNLSQLVDHFPALNDYLTDKARSPLQFSVTEFTPMLVSILPIMETFGLVVLLPKSLKKLLRPALGLSIDSLAGKDIFELSGIISLDSILKFSWQAALGDQFISEEEFRELAQHNSGLVRLKEGYAFVDKEEIAKLIAKLDAGTPVLNTTQRMEALFAETYEGGPVKFSASVRRQLDLWRNGKPPALPAGLQATLRPYQQRGFEWLYSNARFGFGSIIADDMGLGKTLQVITTLLKLKEDGKLAQEAGLVVVPTSLLGNWQREIEKFAPSLSFGIYHGSARKMPDTKKTDVVITTYGVARSDEKKIAALNWAAVVIDESQNIKNPSALQTKAIKKIKAPIRIAMSGTPVENRLLDYWSVLDFTLPKYLGSQKYFKETYGRPIQGERDQAVADRFRSLIAPFVMRRLKSDKRIISDLPDKVTQDEFCSMVPAQVALYKSVVEENMKMVSEATENINRQGLILKLITALKQVCNHPVQFLKKGPEAFAASGKAELFRDRLEGILEAGDKVLVFTQYREMGELLVKLVREEFSLEVPFLHGGCSPKQRNEMVDRFQNDRQCPVLLLSIKAGGTGLNLTAANHVIHYDLWWNPAVEAQATDRAYRIGQDRTVFVHRLITKSSFEEKIDLLIKSKQDLADLSVGTGESWIGKMTDAELKKLVKLG